MKARAKIVGDHSAYHCGSAAVYAVLVRSLQAKYDLVDDDSFDVLFVNGEGSMHHNSGSFTYKMEALKAAVDSGREAHLVNTVWESNDNSFDDILRKLNGITVREAMSREELSLKHGVDAEMALDLSYYDVIDENAEFENWSGQVPITDFYIKEHSLWCKVTHGPLAKSRLYFDMRDLTWSSLVKSLRTCRAVITGRHHGVYAACLAKRPFVAVEGNTHKVAGLIKESGFPIPVLSTPRDANSQVKWAIDNKGMFKEFFKWMDEFPRWTP